LRVLAAVVATAALAAICALAPLTVDARPARAAQDVPPSSVPVLHSAAWSLAKTLSACGAADTVHAAFPRDTPTHATGKGAVVWTAGASCPGGGGTVVSTVGRSDAPGQPSPARAPGGARLALRPPLALAPAPHGQLAIAGSGSLAGGAAGAGLLVQGSAGGPFSTLGTTAGTASQNTLATGYLGDLAAASPTGGGGRAGMRIDVERYFANALSPARIVAARAGSLGALTVSLDFRTDAIVAWHQRGALYARDLPASGHAQPTQRLATVGATPRVTALISDDNRAIVAWADQRPGATSIYLDASGAGVQFGAPQRLERFADPSGLPYPATSPRLVRLSSESVMIAWSGAQNGHWVVRTAAIDLNGIGRIATASDPATNSLLSDLQPGPAGEALALWREPQARPGRGLDTSMQALWAARGIDAFPDRTIFAAPEQIAPAGDIDDATLAFDPDSDRALALWRGDGGSLQYAVRGAGPAPRP
jgi:hypothetical protein